MRIMRKFNVAIVGATGAVGLEFIKVLEQRSFPSKSIRLYASDRSAGKKLLVNGEPLLVQETGPDSFEDIDIALFSAGADISKQLSPIAAKAGAVVIDNSAAFRYEPEIPLVVPEVNPDDISRHRGIIANPNCSTIQMVVALQPLHKINPIQRIVVSTYQAVSGAGTAGIEELESQARSYVEGGELVARTFPHQIAFNLFPHIDVFMDTGYSKEEWKMEVETKKIMHAPQMAISATCVRVPVFMGHSEAVWVQFTDPMPPHVARQVLADSPGVKVIDNPENGQYPVPLQVGGTDEVFVGRIRQDTSVSNGLVMWVVADNVRKGAALNAVQIAETMVDRGWIDRHS